MNFLSLFGQSSYYDERAYTNPPAYDSMYPPHDSATMAAAAGITALAIILGLLIAVAAYVVSSIFLGKIFKKAGIESWKAWVPFYNTWILLELGGQKGFWAVLMIIPVVNIVSVVFLIMAMYQIGLNFGKEGAFVLLAIFLPIVWLIWLAVDKSVWNGPKLATASGAAPQAPTAPATDTQTEKKEEEPSVPPQESPKK